MNWEHPDVQAGFSKDRGTRNQITNICWITEKSREFQKNCYFYFIDYAKVFDRIDHNKPWKIQVMGIPTTLPVSWEIYMQVQKPQLEPHMELQTGSRLGKECIITLYIVTLIM